MSEANPVESPIGVSYIELIKKEVESIIDLWNAHNPAPSWWGKVKGAWVSSVKFLIRTTDHLIKVVEERIPGGADKKATVLAAVELVYDAIVAPNMPIYLLPVNSRIKAFVLNILISLTIDFIVEKYNNGLWIPANKEVASLI